MSNLERGNYFDQWERRDVLDERDLIPVETYVTTNLIVNDLEGYRRILGEDADIRIAESQRLREIQARVTQEFVLIAA